MPAADEEKMIERLVDRVVRRTSAQARGGDEQLQRRAFELADRYLDGVRPQSVRWSARMARRYGSCTPAQGSIRISDRLAGAPAWVLDYVLVHELAHLVVPTHGAQFDALVARYPRAERARGYLRGFQDGQLAAGTLIGTEHSPRRASRAALEVHDAAYDAWDENVDPLCAGPDVADPVSD